LKSVIDCDEVYKISCHLTTLVKTVSSLV